MWGDVFICLRAFDFWASLCAWLFVGCVFVGWCLVCARVFVYVCLCVFMCLRVCVRVCVCLCGWMVGWPVGRLAVLLRVSVLFKCLYFVCDRMWV